MDNKSIATILFETADLLEVRGDDSFRIRSYRRAAETIEELPQQISDLLRDPKQLLAIPNIGKGMVTNLQEIERDGSLALHKELIEKYHPSMLELLKISGMGPKTVALIWDTFQVSDLAGVERLANEGKLAALPRMGEKQVQKILKGIEDYRRISGRFLIDHAESVAQKIIEHLAGVEGIDAITPSGSLRRGRETVGDLDILVTGAGCVEAKVDKLIERVLLFPGIMQVLARGNNKVSFTLHTGMQVDVRFLPPESFGAALQYFTGSKNHNVTLRQRALKMGFTLSEYGLAEVASGKIVVSAKEEEIYTKLGLDFIPPELRENCGEIDAAAEHRLPELVSLRDIRGEVHAHTVETDGQCTIEEMAAAARAHGYEYVAITDHSKNLAFANGLDDIRAAKHIRRIREAAKQIEGIRVLAGIEVDILADGSLDLSDPILADMDVVIASVHSHFKQEPQQMTDRLIRAIQNKHVSAIGHPTGRLLLKRDAYPFDMDAVLKAAAANRCAMEHNAYPDRLDLCDRHLRMARELGVKIVINTDAHHTSHFDKLKFGVSQLRRAWLTPGDVLNTLPADKLLSALRRA